MSTAIISIDFDEFKAGTYRGTRLGVVSEDLAMSEIHTFTTTPAEDVANALSLAREKAEKVFCSSTVDNFITDDPSLGPSVRAVIRPEGTP